MKNKRPGGWSDERRAKQAEAIRRWKPWQQGPGVKTAEGKAISRMNALKHGARAAKARRLSAILREVKDELAAFLKG